MIIEQRVIHTYNLHNPNELEVWRRSKQAYVNKGYTVSEDTFTGVAELRTINLNNLDWLEDQPSLFECL